LAKDRRKLNSKLTAAGHGSNTTRLSSIRYHDSKKVIYNREFTFTVRATTFAVQQPKAIHHLRAYRLVPVVDKERRSAVVLRTAQVPCRGRCRYHRDGVKFRLVRSLAERSGCGCTKRELLLKRKYIVRRSRGRASR